MFKTVYSKLQIIFGVDLLNTLIVTLSLLFASFVSYLLQFYLGRKLTVEGFGDFTVLLSIANIITFFGNTIGYAVVKVYSELTILFDNSKIKWLLLETFKYAGIVGLAAGALCILLSNSVSSFLSIESTETVVLFGLYLMSVLIPIYVAVFLQGTYRFILFSLFIAISAILRLIVPALFINFSSPTPSIVYLGLFVASLLSMLFGFFLIILSNQHKFTATADKTLLNNIVKGSVYNGLALFTLTLMISVDVIAVKYFFDPFEAGIYSGVVTLGKIILFGAGTVATVMFPRAVSVNKDYKKFKALVTKFGMIQLAFVGVAALFFAMFPGFITDTLFSNKFTESIPYVVLYTLFVSLYVLLNFMILALIALGEKKFSLYMPFFLLLQVVGFLFFHVSMYQIIWVNIISLLLLFAFMLFNISMVLKKMKIQESVTSAS